MELKLACVCVCVWQLVEFDQDNDEAKAIFPP